MCAGSIEQHDLDQLERELEQEKTSRRIQEQL